MVSIKTTVLLMPEMPSMNWIASMCYERSDMNGLCGYMIRFPFNYYCQHGTLLSRAPDCTSFKIPWHEDISQGDSLSMLIYSVGFMPMVRHLKEDCPPVDIPLIFGITPPVGIPPPPDGQHLVCRRYWRCRQIWCNREILQGPSSRTNWSWFRLFSGTIIEEGSFSESPKRAVVCSLKSNATEDSKLLRATNTYRRLHWWNGKKRWLHVVFYYYFATII